MGWGGSDLWKTYLGKEPKKDSRTCLFENLLATVFTTDVVFDYGVVLAEVLVETGNSVEGEPDTNEVYHFVEKFTGSEVSCKYLREGETRGKGISGDSDTGESR